jgi:hypothetical protein
VKWTYYCGKQQTTLNGYEGILNNTEIQRDPRLGDGLVDGRYLILSNLPSPFAKERHLSRHGPVAHDLFGLNNPVYFPKMKVVGDSCVRNDPDGQRTGAWLV